MEKVNLCFDVNDIEYFEKLKEYIMLNYQTYFNIVPGKDELNGGYLISDYLNKRNNKNILIFGNGNCDVYKFQKASEICSAILEKYSKEYNLNEALPVKENSLKIVCVTSALGGAGKSTVAKAICCKFAEWGKKAIYINPDSFATGETVFSEGNENAFTRLRYCIRKENKNINAVMESLISREETRRVDYIVNASPSADGFMQKNEVNWFVSKIIRNCTYDLMVIDIPSYLSEGHIEFLKLSAVNVVVLIESMGKRQQNFMDYLKKREIPNIIEVFNFTESKDISLPKTEKIFNMYPNKYWDCIEKLCIRMEVSGWKT